MPTAIVQLRIIDINGSPVKGASFQVKSMRDNSTLTLKVREDELFGVYDILPDNYHAGRHEITVSADGYSSHTQQADFYVNGYADTIVLLDTNERNTSIRFLGKGRQPILLRENLVKIRQSSDPQFQKTASAIPSFLNRGENAPEIISEKIMPNGAKTLVIDVAKDKPSSLIDPGWEVVGEGAIMIPGNPEPQFPDGTISVSIKIDLDPMEVRRKLEFNGIEILQSSPNGGRHLLLKAPSKDAEVVLGMIEKLQEEGEFEEVLFNAEGEDVDTVLPADILRPIQWYFKTTKVHEAWDEGSAMLMTFGSADVIITAHDSGIQTIGGLVQHPELSGVVTGGNLNGNLPNTNKVYYQIDFNRLNVAAPPLIVNNNDATSSQHGTWVSGILSANTDGTRGIVGIGANTRLMSVFRNPSRNDTARAHSFSFMAGFDPGWQPGGGLYNPLEPFPVLFGQQANGGPGTSIVNCSHAFGGPPLGLELRTVFQRTSLLGRSRRGIIIVGASGNGGTNTRIDSIWGNEVNVIKVGASTLNHLEEEIHAPYSCFSVFNEPNYSIDVVAPSHNSAALTTPHMPPTFWGIPTIDFLTGGDIFGVRNTFRNIVAVTVVANVSHLQMVPADFALFPNSTPVLIRETGNIEHTEMAIVIGRIPATNTLILDRKLMYGYVVASELITAPNLDYFSNFGGTSAATPQVSGIISLMLSLNPKLTFTEVRQILRETAVPIALSAQDTAFPVVIRRWVDEAGNNILDHNGQLILNAATATTTAFPINKGDTEIHVTSSLGFSTRQALLIGAQSALSAPVAGGASNLISVIRNNDFELGDVIWIGKQVQTVLIVNALIGTVSINVASVDGFAVDDFLNVGGQFLQISSFGMYRPWAGEEQATIINFRYLGPGPGPGLSVALNAGQVVSISQIAAVGNTPQLEGPFTIQGKPSAGQLQLNTNVIFNHPLNRVVTTQNAELRAVLEIKPGNVLRVAPISFNHPLPGPPNPGPALIWISGGAIAAQSFALGFGRVDAAEAVKAARGYTHTRDLMIRNFLADDGVANRNTNPVHSPDIWNTNDAPTPAGLTINNPGPHQRPISDISAPLFFGVGLNDLAVDGHYTGATIGTYIIEIITTGATDQFRWVKDNGAFSAPANITVEIIAIAEGVSVTFNAITGHTTSERWYIFVAPVVNRQLHLRYQNRGTLTTFARSTGANNIPVQTSRLALCVSDGGPVKKYFQSPRGLRAGTVALPDNMQVVTDFGGTTKLLYTIHISATAAGGDSFQSAKNTDAALSAATVIVAGTDYSIGAGSDLIKIHFTANTGHTVGDRWIITCHPAASPANKWVNIDHYPDNNVVAVAPPPSLTSNFPSTWLMDDSDATPLAGGANRYYSKNWPETARPPRNGFGRTISMRKRRLFVLGETIPHDGELMSDYNSGNNNFSYKEICFTRFIFRENTGFQDLRTFLEVDGIGSTLNYPFRVFALSDAGTFGAEQIELEFVINNANNTTETVTYKNTDGVWTKTPSAAAWVSCTPPLVTGTANSATNEQWSIMFVVTLTVNNLNERVKITAKQLSSVTNDFAITSETKLIPIYHQALLPSQRFSGGAKADLSPKSHFFTEPANIVQTATEAFGPVGGDTANRFRATALFKRVGATEPKAYAVTKGLIAVQRDPANMNCVNIILRPFNQPMLGFTPVKYFIYRGITLTDILKGTSSTDEKLIRDEAGSPPFISRIWGDHTNQNGTGVPFEAKALGYDPVVQTATDLLDDLFFRHDLNFQFPSASMGETLGTFFTNSGANSFGFEIILEEGEFQPDLAYARKDFHEITVAGLPSVTDADKFTIRMKREEVLNFMDPAAFYGLHRSVKGQITVNDGAGNTTVLTPENMFTNMINKFYTKNVLYVDIRNENGQSYNFYTKYVNGSGKALKYGLTAADIADQIYSSDGWPLIIIPRTEAANANDFDELFIALRKDYNKSPIIYIEHGRTTTKVTKGRFIADAELGTNATYTSAIGFRFPNTAGVTAGNKIGTVWLLKLHYGLQLDVTNTPFPSEVPPTETYLDNLFGPLSLIIKWSGTFNFAWYSAQDKKFLDADSIGFSQVVNRGIAIQDRADPNDRVLFYATSKDSFNNTNTRFVPYKSLPGGISKRDSFFDEALLIDGYVLNYDLIQDGTTEIKSLRLEPATIDPRPVEAMLALGMTKIQYDALKAVAGFNSTYPRNVQLDPVADSPFTVNGNLYYKYRAGVKGMDVDGDHRTAFPTEDIFVYSVDQLFFFSAQFSALQVLPTEYKRNYEENLGLAIRSNARYRISGMQLGTDSVQILGKDLRYEIISGDRIVIKGSTSHDGSHEVTGVSWDGTLSQITIAHDLSDNTNALGDMHETDKAFEDFFIDKDIRAVINGTNPMRTIINEFVAAVTAATDTAAGLSALTSAANTYSLQAWNRARELCFADTHAYADDRILYWARIKMLVALKGHPQVLKSIKERNRLVKLFEDGSRGISSVNIPATGKKVVIAAFDPYYLGKNILRNNPGAAAALAMDGRDFTVTVNGNPVSFHVEAVVLPVRYDEMDRNGGTGIIEDVLEKFINPGAIGFKVVDLLLSLGVSEGRRFELSRYAARKRGGVTDNASRPSPPSNPAFVFPVSMTGVAYYETKLPVTKMVPATNPGSNGFDIIYDNSFKYNFTDAGGVVQTSEFPDSANAAGNFNAEDVGHSNHASLVGIVPSDLTSGTTPKFADITSVEGSAGNYFSNEIMYRIMRLRALYSTSLPAGHLRVPNVQPDMGEFVPLDNANVITAIIDEIARSLAP